jgi:integration host factor subunit beta
MTKSELIEQIAAKHTQLSSKDIELAVKAIIGYMADVLSEGGRIEIRGFGSFSLHYRAPRTGRNPKTGEPVVLSGKYVPHFKPGKELRDRVNASLQDSPTTDLQDVQAAAPVRDAVGSQGL